MDEHIPVSKTSARRKVKLWVGIVCILVVLLAMGLALRHMMTPSSLLPKKITNQITGFTPYFFTDKIPAGYTVHKENVTFDNNILMVPLSNPNAPGIVLTEQAVPASLKSEDLFQNGEKVEDVEGRASINSVEGRLVGTMIPTDHKLLILLNAPGTTQKEDLSSLLKALRPID